MATPPAHAGNGESDSLKNCTISCKNYDVLSLCKQDKNNFSLSDISSHITSLYPLHKLSKQVSPFTDEEPEQEDNLASQPRPAG